MLSLLSSLPSHRLWSLASLSCLARGGSMMFGRRLFSSEEIPASFSDEIKETILSKRDSIISNPCFIAEVQYFSAQDALLLQQATGLAESSSQLKEEGWSRFIVGTITPVYNNKRPSQNENNDNNNDNNMVRLSLEDDEWEGEESHIVTELMDLVCPSNSGQKRIEDGLRSVGAASIWHGEVDGIGVSDWQYGFAKHHTMCIFDTHGVLAEIGQENGVPLLLLRDYKRSIPLDDIVDVRVTLSANWDRRALVVTHLIENADEKSEVEGVELVVDFHINNNSNETDSNVAGVETLEETEKDETELMVTTEWMVKAAGSLIVALKNYGYDAQLRLPRQLLPSHNPQVAQRMAAWMASLK
eukprot:m.67727 g.67727  ORF g.67727 m.67727 type:complete len:357 (-) comp8225_c0_seq4:551-1621(-)